MTRSQSVPLPLVGREQAEFAVSPNFAPALSSRRAAPHIDAGEQEQPHDVDEMPVPGGELETEMPASS